MPVTRGFRLVLVAIAALDTHAYWLNVVLALPKHKRADMLKDARAWSETDARKPCLVGDRCLPNP